MVGEINWNLLNPNTPAQVAGSFQQGQANRLAMEQAGQEKAMNALRLKREQQAMTDEETMRNVYAQSGGDMGKVVAGLKQAGQYQPAMEIEGKMSAQQAAQRKAQIEDGLQRIQVIGQLAGGVQDQATYDAARQQIASLYGPEAAAKMPEVYDPNAVNQFRNQAMTAAQQLEQQWKALDYGMKREQFSFEKQKFGATQGLEREKMRQSAAQHAATQQLEREKLGGTTAKLTETQGKATGFASRANEADAVFKELQQKGVDQPGTIKRIAESTPLIGAGLGTMANITQSEKQQQVEQAQRNFINAILRQESGAVIGPDEFDNARKQYFPQPGDSAAVKKQKADNRSTAIRALEVQAGPGMKMMGGLPGGWSVEEH